ncbi:MAG: PKD domain-containing protein [Thermoplasmata archaeon]|nr:PKD domain-containing protein [Thermoplasmata archaeon]
MKSPVATARLITVAIILLSSTAASLDIPGRVAVSEPNPPGEVANDHSNAPPAVPSGLTINPNPFNWTEWNLTNPPVRVWEGLAYDTIDGYTLLFGGEGQTTPGSDYPPINDTWIYKHQTWTEVCSGTNATPRCGESPPAGAASMTFDPSDGYVLLVDRNGDSWAFEGGLWRTLNASGTPPICADITFCGETGTPLAYDPITGDVVMLAGNGDTWSFSGGNWTEVATGALVPMGSDAVLFFDPAYSDLVFTNSGGEYLYDNGSWPKVTNSSQPAGYVSGGDYDPVLGAEVIALSGNHASGPGAGPSSTWILKGKTWTNLSSSLAREPPPRYWSVMIWDGSDGYNVMFDGKDPSANDYNSTWALIDPLIANVSASPDTIEIGQNSTLNWSVGGGLIPYTLNITGFPAGCEGSVSGVSVICSPQVTGNFQLRLEALDPSTNSTSVANANFTVYPRFSASAFATPGSSTLGFPVFFTGVVVGGRTPYFNTWRLGDGATSNSDNTSHLYGSSGPFNVSFTANDSLGGMWIIYLQVQINLPLSMVAGSNVSTTDAGLPVLFSALPKLGTPPDLISWSFGDGSTAATAVANHSYASSGEYRIGVTATDAVGDAARDTLNDTVHPPLSVDLTINDSRPQNGSYVEFTGSASGGTSPFRYKWVFGDGQSGGINGTSPGESFSHRYIVKGNFTAELQVTDALGIVRTAQLTLEVAGTPNTTVIVPPLAQSGLSGSTLLEIGVGAAAVILAGVAITVYYRRRGRSPSTGSSPAA